jgi:hypothetical protein
VLAILNAIALAGESRGFSIRYDENEGRTALAGHEAAMQLRITQQLEKKTRTRRRYDGATAASLLVASLTRIIARW